MSTNNLFCVIDEFEYEDVQELRAMARMMDDEPQDNPQPPPEPPADEE